MCADVTRVPLDRQQVVGDAPHGLQGGVRHLVRREDDVLRVGGAAPGQDGDGVRLPTLQRPVAHVDEKLHVGQPHLREQNLGQVWSRSRAITRALWCTGGQTGHLSAQREQHLVGEHLEVGVSAQGAAVQLVVDDGVVDETPPVGEAVGHFLSEALQVHLGKRLEVGGNLRLVRRTLHGALPVGGVRHRAVAVLMVDWT